MEASGKEVTERDSQEEFISEDALKDICNWLG